MIFDSEPWKMHLLSSGRKVARWRRQRRWLASSIFNLEREIFFAFYAIRKLLEAKTHISWELRDTQTSVRCYAATGKAANILNWQDLDLLYDLSRSTQKQLPLVDLCNSIVHSYVFMPFFGPDGGLQSILFNTDREKDNWLFELKADKLQKLLENVADDGILDIHLRRQPDGEWKVLQASRKPHKLEAHMFVDTAESSTD